MRDTRRAGQIIDLREGKEFTRPDLDIPFGLIVVIAKDGTINIDVKDPERFFDQVLGDVQGAVQGLATIEAATEAAKTVVGDSAMVTTEPSASN